MHSASTGNIIGPDTISQQKSRYQKGSLLHKHGAWYAVVATFPTSTSGGSRKQQWVRLGSLADFPQEDDIYPHFIRFMQLVNEELGTSDDSPRLLTFIERTYLPGLTLAPSTIAGYKDCHKHVLRHLGDHTLASLKPADVFELLQKIADESKVSKTTLQHIKHFLGGVYSWARNHGHFDGASPVQGVNLPRARRPKDTYAYDLEEEQLMMEAVKDDLRSLTAIAIPSWSGVSMSELEALQWEDLKKGHIYVSRSIVEGHIGETKTEWRRAPVPIIPELQKIIDQYRESLGSPTTGWLFPSENPDKPMRMNNLYNRHMADAFKKAAIVWHGWHAFRRGLATNLDELGVPLNVVQQILRHGDPGTTGRFYRKTRSKRVVDAMNKLQTKVGSKGKSVRHR